MQESEKRKRFFKTALQLIHEKGFKAMTMRDLAKQLDCDPSNIYNYVRSKHALLEQLLFEISNKFHEGMVTIEAANTSPLEKLKAIISLHVRLTVEHPYQVTLLVHEWRNLRSDDTHKKLEEFISFRTTYEKKMKSIIAQGVEQGELIGENLEFTTNCVLSSIRWLYTWHQPNNPSIHPAELERLMINFVLKGVSSGNEN